MALDLKAVKQRLNKLQTAANTTSWKWRPDEDSESTVRLVPFKHNPSYPFIELFFHYNFGKTYLSPMSFGEPDPVVEFAEQLKSTGEKDDWLLARKIEPKLRTYAPIVVRGEEDKGVRFWGFGKTVYEQLLTYMADEDYGDITDPTSGRDIKIVYKSAKTVGKNYPETTILPRGKSTKLVSDAAKMQKILDEQPKLDEVFEREWTTYDDLKAVFEKWISNDGNSSVGSGGGDDEDADDDDTGSELEESVASKIDDLFADD